MCGNLSPQHSMKNCVLNIDLVLGASHLAADFRAFATGLDAIVHTSHLFTALGARIADIRANRTLLLIEGRTAQHEIAGGLAYLGAVDHQTKMRGFDIFPARIKAMCHRCMQTGVVAFRAGRYASLQAGVCFGGHRGMAHEWYP